MINYRHPQVQEDLKQLLEQNIPWHLLRDRAVLITGATGMLASYVGFTLLYLNEQLSLDITPIFLARNKEKLERVYGEALSQVHCLVQDVCEPMQYDGIVDYIFHAAGAASPHYILNDPIGVINSIVQGTQQVLELARNSQTKNVVFASTREVYGHVADKSSITETDMGVLDPLNPRNCYPESKRLAEALLMAYHTQYNINFNSMRIAHTYGPGMQIRDDGRVMSDFINDAVNARDIILKSTGKAERAFCYVTDAVSGIFRVMLQGEATKAYNLANEKEPIRLIELAHLLQQLAGNGKGMKIAANETNNAGYTNYARTALNTSRLKTLNWQPVVGLKDGLTRTLKTFDKVE